MSENLLSFLRRIQFLPSTAETVSGEYNLHKNLQRAADPDWSHTRDSSRRMIRFALIYEANRVGFTPSFIAESQSGNQSHWSFRSFAEMVKWLPAITKRLSPLSPF
jgi:hypothetical protein